MPDGGEGVLGERGVGVVGVDFVDGAGGEVGTGDGCGLAAAGENDEALGWGGALGGVGGGEDHGARGVEGEACEGVGEFTEGGVSGGRERIGGAVGGFEEGGEEVEGELPGAVGGEAVDGFADGGVPGEHGGHVGFDSLAEVGGPARDLPLKDEPQNEADEGTEEGAFESDAGYEGHGDETDDEAENGEECSKVRGDGSLILGHGEMVRGGGNPQGRRVQGK